jgi:hypothetical protein
MQLAANMLRAGSLELALHKENVSHSWFKSFPPINLLSWCVFSVRLIRAMSAVVNHPGPPR